MTLMEAVIGAVAALFGAVVGAGAGIIASRHQAAASLRALATDLARERNTVMERGHLDEIERDRSASEELMNELFRLKHELLILDYVSRLDHWHTAVGEASAAPASIPLVAVTPALAGRLPWSLLEKLAFITAHRLRYEAAKEAHPDRCWVILKEIGVEARQAIEVISAVASGVVEGAAKHKADGYATRNAIAETRDALIATLVGRRRGETS